MQSEGLPLLYHEKQVAALCGVHCLNTLLQGPYLTEVDLAQIAQDLDALERQFMAEGGIEGQDFLRYMAEESGNVAADGMFSIQVLSNALEVWNLECIPLDSPDAAQARLAPEREAAFICNLEQHWFAVRPVGDQWWNLNSTFPAPQPLSQFYLSAFLASLREQGFTIFVIKGRLPNPYPDMGSPDVPGRWFTPEEARAASKSATDAKQQGYLKAALEGAMAQARRSGGVLSLAPSGSKSSRQPAEIDDDDLARALAASLAESGQAQHLQQAPAAVSGDADLAAALAASLAGVAMPARPPERQAPEAATGSALPDAPAAGNMPVVPPEPEAGAAGTVEIAFRLPDGSRVLRRFCNSDPVGAVEAFLASAKVDMNQHRLIVPFPRKVLSDPAQSLSALGLGSKEMLAVERYR